LFTVWRMKPCYREKEERKITPDDREAQCTVVVNSAHSIFKTITVQATHYKVQIVGSDVMDIFPKMYPETPCTGLTKPSTMLLMRFTGHRYSRSFYIVHSRIVVYWASIAISDLHLQNEKQ